MSFLVQNKWNIVPILFCIREKCKIPLAFSFKAERCALNKNSGFVWLSAPSQVCLQPVQVRGHISHQASEISVALLDRWH